MSVLEEHTSNEEILTAATESYELFYLFWQGYTRVNCVGGRSSLDTNVLFMKVVNIFL